MWEDKREDRGQGRGEERGEGGRGTGQEQGRHSRPQLAIWAAQEDGWRFGRQSGGGSRRGWARRKMARITADCGQISGPDHLGVLFRNSTTRIATSTWTCCSPRPSRYASHSTQQVWTAPPKYGPNHLGGLLLVKTVSRTHSPRSECRPRRQNMALITSVFCLPCEDGRGLGSRRGGVGAGLGAEEGRHQRRGPPPARGPPFC